MKSHKRQRKSSKNPKLKKTPNPDLSKPTPKNPHLKYIKQRKKPKPQSKSRPQTPQNTT